MATDLKNYSNDQLIARLKELIAIELDHCSKDDYPYVCNISSSADGKKQIEEMVIKYCSDSGITVGQALARIERAYNPNKMED
jgi:hypothetical protein